MSLWSAVRCRMAKEAALTEVLLLSSDNDEVVAAVLRLQRAEAHRVDADGDVLVAPAVARRELALQDKSERPATLAAERREAVKWMSCDISGKWLPPTAFGTLPQLKPCDA